MEFEPLKGWENFYVITGSAAAGLTGLTFVVIALVRDAQRTSLGGLGAFVTPTIVHFTIVLSLAAFLSVPRLTPRGLEIGIAVVGVAGLAYVGVITRWIVYRMEGYLPVLEDWMFNVILPGAAYAGLLGSALEIARRPAVALEVVAGSSLLLLLIGIHNAWDIAVWMSLHKPDQPATAPAPASKDESKPPS